MRVCVFLLYSLRRSLPPSAPLAPPEHTHKHTEGTPYRVSLLLQARVRARQACVSLAHAATIIMSAAQPRPQPGKSALLRELDAIEREKGCEDVEARATLKGLERSIELFNLAVMRDRADQARADPATGDRPTTTDPSATHPGHPPGFDPNQAVNDIAARLHQLQKLVEDLDGPGRALVVEGLKELGWGVAGTECE